MRNLLYFVEKNKDISFDSLPFCEVDSLMLSQLVYLNWEGFVHKFEEGRKSLSIKCFEDQGTFERLSINTYDYKDNIKLLKLLCNSKRYENMKINELVGVMDYNKYEQFFALTYIFDDFIYVCYRGTDISILGWKENFDMSYRREVPSQRDSVYYLNNVGNKYNLPIYLGGHSKGGNLALYAAMNASFFIKDRIKEVYSFDGPGFSYDIFATPEFYSIKNRVKSYIIHNSLVGVLMFHYNDVTLVKTSGISIFQHDPYNWHVKKNFTLKTTKKSTITSGIVGNTTRELIIRTSESERQKYVNVIFNYLWVKPTLTTIDMFKHPINFLKNYNNHKKSIPEEDRKSLVKLRKLFRSCLKHAIKENFKIQHKDNKIKGLSNEKI